MKRKFIRDQTGEGFIDVAITILIIFTLMASLPTLYPVFTAQQSLNQTAKYLARTVELYGKAVPGKNRGAIRESSTWQEPWSYTGKRTMKRCSP